MIILLKWILHLSDTKATELKIKGHSVKLKWLRNYYNLLEMCYTGDKICKVYCTNYWTADRYSESIIRLVIDLKHFYYEWKLQTVFLKVELLAKIPQSITTFYHWNIY